MEETGRSGFVAGAILLEPTDELIEKALAVEGRENIITINRELLETSLLTVVVWNIKTYATAWKWIDKNRHLVRKTDTELEEMRKYRRLDDKTAPFYNYHYQRFLYWLRQRIGDTKPDAYGLPGGKIEEYEYAEGDARKKLFQTATDYVNGGEHYSDYAFHRELVEETGFTALLERKNDAGNIIYRTNEKGIEIPVYDSLFERVIQFYEEDREHPGDPTYQHEDFFFWVREVIGKMRKTGVEEETLAPEVVPIKSLNRSCAYKKHMHGLMATLNMLIREHGKGKQYREALEYLQKTFPPSKKLSREPSIRTPELTGLADKDMFAYAMALDKVKPLRR